jgi:DNA topoisomerase 2-associated protein PAT1
LPWFLTFFIVGFSPAPKSLESIWDDKSPFSVLSRVVDHQRVPSSLKSSFPTSKSPALNAHTDHRPLSQQQPITHRVAQTGVRTLQEIEAEMRAAQQKRKQQEEMLLQVQMQEVQREEELRRQEEFLREQLEMQDLQRFQREQLLADRMRARLEQEQQLRLQQQARMPTPRVVSHLPLVSSPRFNQQHQHQQQILLLQQEQERQQQERLKELQERLRMEEIERQLRAQQISQLQQPPNVLARRQSPYADTQRRTHSPAFESQYALLNQQNTQYLPQSIQLQQRLLSEMAQVEFMRDMQGISQAEQEALRVEAMRKIMETERMEEKRRRKAAKIAHMVMPPTLPAFFKLITIL